MCVSHFTLPQHVDRPHDRAEWPPSHSSDGWGHVIKGLTSSVFSDKSVKRMHEDLRWQVTSEVDTSCFIPGKTWFKWGIHIVVVVKKKIKKTTSIFI